MGVPYRATEDEWYDGMYMTKGTVFITNLWHMNRDREFFGMNTEHFDPARYSNWMPLGELRLSCPAAIPRAVLAARFALVATWPTILFSSA